MIKTIFLAYLTLNFAEANAMEQSFHQGKERAAKEDLSKLIKKAPKLPGSEGTPPVIKDENTLKYKTARTKNDAASFVEDSYKTRPQIKIDPETNPLLTGGDKIAQDPLKVLQETGDSFEEGGTTPATYTQKTCREDHSVVFRTGSQTLHVWVDHIREKKQKQWDCGGHRRKGNFVKNIFVERTKRYCSSNDPHCRAKINERWVVVRNRSFQERENWTGADYLEAEVDQEKCTYHQRVCRGGQETRTIYTTLQDGDGPGPTLDPNTRVDPSPENRQHPVTRPCWHYEVTYACGEKKDQGCQTLRHQGCVQIGSRCTRQEKGFCTRWEHTFECLSQGGRNRPARVGGSLPFCLGGPCVSHAYEDNKEFGEAISKLSLLDTLQHDNENGMKAFFTGEANHCAKDMAHCRDCCFSLSGWGISLHVGSCSQKEKELAQKRSKGICHWVGTECTTRVLGLCMQKRSTYCCFKNKLARLINEQGRQQLGKGWGSASHPDCGGLTLDDIMKIDFSQLDLKEMYEDWMKQANPEDGKKVTQRIKGNLKNIQSSRHQDQKKYDKMKRN